MIVALGQFAVSPYWQENVKQCVHRMQEAERKRAALLVLPEAVLATDIADPLCIIREAQPLDGPFMMALLAASTDLALTTVLTLHVPASEEKVFNVLVAIRGGKIVAKYCKLHLYDAFAMQESVNVQAGDELPPVIDVEGMQVGLMTCYDLRFPEVAKSLALRGAELLVLPAAWVNGLHKEHHWETLLAARALDTTCFIAAVSESGPRNIGCSMLVDPLGIVVARADKEPVLMLAECDYTRLMQVRSALPVLANGRFAPPQLS